MNSNRYCTPCKKDCKTAAGLRSHNQYERNKGNTIGHEIKVGQSTAGSQIGENKNFNDFAGTNHKDGKYLFSFLFLL